MRAYRSAKTPRSADSATNPGSRNRSRTLRGFSMPGDYNDDARSNKIPRDRDHPDAAPDRVPRATTRGDDPLTSAESLKMREALNGDEVTQKPIFDPAASVVSIGVLSRRAAMFAFAAAYSCSLVIFHLLRSASWTQAILLDGT